MTAAPTLAERFFPDSPVATEEQEVLQLAIVLLTIWHTLAIYRSAMGAEADVIDAKLRLVSPEAMSIRVHPADGLDDLHLFLMASKLGNATLIAQHVGAPAIEALVLALEADMPPNFGLGFEVAHVRRLAIDAVDHVHANMPRIAP